MKVQCPYLAVTRAFNTNPDRPQSRQAVNWGTEVLTRVAITAIPLAWFFVFCECCEHVKNFVRTRRRLLGNPQTCSMKAPTQQGLTLSCEILTGPKRLLHVVEGVNDTHENLMASIAKGETEISPSSLYAVACIEEGVAFINGSPQNTFVPGA
eukprot:1160892-Pelagomonas_calceolata.AAC.7